VGNPLRGATFRLNHEHFTYFRSTEVKWSFAMAYELRADREGVAVATLNTKSDAFEAAIGVLRTHKMDRAIVAWDDDGTLSFTKTGSKNPMLYVVKSGPKDRTAEPKRLGRPPIDQTDVKLSAMPPGAEVWHYLQGKKQRVFKAPLNPDPAWGNDRRPRRFAFVLDAQGKVLSHYDFSFRKEAADGGFKAKKLYTSDTDVMNAMLGKDHGWPKQGNPTHILVGTLDVQTQQFTGRWCYRRA
jgi:hypothetical protein